MAAYWDDGDPLDVLVLCQEAVTPGVLMRAQAIGVMRMRNDKGRDDKLIAVHIDDPYMAEYNYIGDLPRMGTGLSKTPSQSPCWEVSDGLQAIDHVIQNVSGSLFADQTHKGLQILTQSSPNLAGPRGTLGAAGDMDFAAGLVVLVRTFDGAMV